MVVVAVVVVVDFGGGELEEGGAGCLEGFQVHGVRGGE